MGVKHRLLLVLISLFFCIGNAIAKTPIKGTVTDEQKIPLPGVSVVLKGTTVGTVTDMNGQFTLSLDQLDKGELEFSFIGLKTQDISLHNQSQLDITMESETSELSEVVVTGYGGIISREKVTSSISNVDDEMLQSGNRSNVSRALTGSVAGMSVKQTTGRATSEPSIVLRGGTDLGGGGSPLIIVDGMIRDALGGLNPEDIESMDVLKDAAATAIYGARANNGVILITTKQGKEGRATVTLSTKQSLAFFIPTYDFLDGHDYLYWSRTGAQNTIDAGRAPASILTDPGPFGTGNKYYGENGEVLNGNEDPNAVWSTMYYDPSLSFLLDEGWKTMTDPITGRELIYKEFNYQKHAINSPSYTQEYNVNVSGGNDKGKYYAGLGYYHQEDLPVDTWYERITFTTNGEYKINNWLTSTSNVSLNLENWQPMPFGSNSDKESQYFGRMLSAPPTMRGYTPDGEPLVGFAYQDGNMEANEGAFYRRNDRRKMNFAQTLSFDLTKELNLRIFAGWIYDESQAESFNDDYINTPGNVITTHESSASYSRNFKQTYNAVLSGHYIIKDDHNVDFLVGTEAYDAQSNSISASGEGAPTGDFRDLDLTTLDYGKRGVSSSHSRNRILSFMGRLNYDYQGKYIFSFIFREDGYSKLPKGNQWGFFPGFSGGWILHKEKFVQSFLPSQINFLKLRASYGLNGNVSGLGDYTVQGSYGANIYDGDVGFNLDAVQTDNLKWEKSHTFEIGLDMGLFNGKVNLAGTYYNRLTSDKISNIDLPVESGVSAIRTNNGAIRNQGLEFTATYNVIDTKDWKWSISANASRNKNMVVELPYNGMERNRQGATLVYDGASGKEKWVGGYQEGQEPGEMYAPKVVRLLRTQEEVVKYANNLLDIEGDNAGPAAYEKLSEADKKNYDKIEPGDYLFEDVNHDNIIDNKDLKKVGTSQQRWFGGLNTTVSYKHLTFFMRTDFATGHYQHNSGKEWYLGMMQGSFNNIEEVKDTWTPDNIDAKYPKVYQADQSVKHNYSRGPSTFYKKASYLAFREVSLAYDLPQNWMDYMHFQKVNLNMSLQNLGYITKSDTYNPESAGNISYSGYPLPITFTMGATITL